MSLVSGNKQKSFLERDMRKIGSVTIATIRTRGRSILLNSTNGIA